MKTKFLLGLALLCLSLTVQAQELVRIVRWKSPVTGDFESMPEGRHTDQQLQSWGFSTKTYQYSAYKDLPNDPNAIAVYRWTMPQCNASIMLGEHEISDAQLRSWGYKDKELQFYAYRTKPATGDYVAVNRWINAKPQGDPCRDFTLTVAETELTDQQLISYGYSSKTTQFWVARPIKALTLVTPTLGQLGKKLGNSVITSLGRENKQKPEKYSNEASSSEDGEFCTTRKVDLQESNFERIVIGGVMEKVYPGALLMGKSVLDGSFVPYTESPRNPLQIRIDMFGANSGNSLTTVNSPVSGGTVQNGIKTLIQRNRNTGNPARLTFDVKKIDSEEELKVFVQGDYSGFGVRVQTTFDYRNKTKSNVILARATQAYFTVAVDNDNGLVTNQSAASDEAVYISAVTYGRIGYLRIESDESEEKVLAALNGSYSGANLEMKAEYERIKRNSTIVGFFLGGSAQLAASTITGFDAFQNWVVQGARWDPTIAPTPISYKLRYLRDQRDAYVTMITSYTERNCQKAKYLKITLLGLTSDIRQNGMAGYVKMEAYELKDRSANLIARQVFPEGEAEGQTLLWQANRALGVPPVSWKQNNAPPRNIQKTWYFYFDPRKVGNGEIKIRIAMKIDAWHKDNDFSVEGWHGMGNEETQEFRLTDALNGNDEIGNNKYLVVGPYRSHSRSDRPHEFRAIFEVKPLN